MSNRADGGPAPREGGGLLEGIKSPLRVAREGGRLVGSNLASIRELNRRALSPGRRESFGDAMGRLGMTEQSLGLIHNQLVLQVYVCAFFASAAFAFALGHLLRDAALAGLAAAALGGAALANAAQASIRAYSIRARRLGVAGEWLVSPGEWFASRIDGYVPMTLDDPRRDPLIIERKASWARRAFWAALSGALVAVVPELRVPALLVAALSFVLFLHGAFEVFRRRLGAECDLLCFVESPRAWWPSAGSATRSPAPGGKAS